MLYIKVNRNNYFYYSDKSKKEKNSIIEEKDGATYNM